MLISTNHCPPYPQEFPNAFPEPFLKAFLKPFPKLFSKPFPKLFPKLFPKPFPEPFPKPFPELEADWLAPHHPIPNAKFPPITALLNRSAYHTYHKSAKGSASPCPQISWEPEINE